MKKGILCILLSLLLLVPMFTSCQKEADLTETEASIYTLYTIVDEKDGWGKLKSGAGWISLKYTTKV